MPYDTFFGINLPKSCTMGDRPGDLFFDPNTGDDMVDKDDLFREEDGTNPQNQDGEGPSSDEEDDIIELLDTVEMSAEDIGEDIVELTDMVEVNDDEILDLTEEAKESVADDDILDLTEVATDRDEAEDDILELTDIAAAENTEDDIIDLTEPVTEDEVFDLLDTVEIPAQDMTEETGEVVDTPGEAVPDTDDDLFEADEAVADIDIDEAFPDLAETDEAMEPAQEERFQETVSPLPAGYEEDKELLELIDDIQATLNDEPVTSRASDQESTPQTDEPNEGDTLEKDDDAYTFLDDDVLIEDEKITESETEFVDHLGIDLTSEIEKNALEKSREEVLEDVKPTESLEPDVAPDAIETAVKKALAEMLADENSPLARAIENAVKRALGQEADS